MLRRSRPVGAQLCAGAGPQRPVAPGRREAAVAGRERQLEPAATRMMAESRSREPPDGDRPGATQRRPTRAPPMTPTPVPGRSPESPARDSVSPGRQRGRGGLAVRPASLGMAARGDVPTPPTGAVRRGASRRAPERRPRSRRPRRLRARRSFFASSSRTRVARRSAGRGGSRRASGATVLRAPGAMASRKSASGMSASGRPTRSATSCFKVSGRRSRPARRRPASAAWADAASRTIARISAESTRRRVLFASEHPRHLLLRRPRISSDGGWSHWWRRARAGRAPGAPLLPAADRRRRRADPGAASR